MLALLTVIFLKVILKMYIHPKMNKILYVLTLIFLSLSLELHTRTLKGCFYC